MEYKFKAWDKINKQMEDIDGCNLYLADGKVYEVYEGGGMNWYPHLDKNDVSDRYIPLQYTNVHDETDDETEIYNHDIVEFEYEGKTDIGEVKFEAGTYILACNSLTNCYITLLDIIENDRDYFWITGKVIGNKFQNPELLT